MRGNIYTNGVENAWSLFKRSAVGEFDHVSTKHLDSYFDEFEWRFNNRQNPYLFRDTANQSLGSAKMEFRELVGKISYVMPLAHKPPL